MSKLFNFLSALVSKVNTLNGDLYYKPGDTEFVHLHTAGILTSGGTTIYFPIPLSKPLKGVTSITSDNCELQLRQAGKYILGGPDSWLLADSTTFTIQGATVLCTLKFNSAPTDAINNDVVAVSLHANIKFN